MHSSTIEDVPLTSLRPYANNARRHSKKQIRQIANSIEHFGFTNPVLISHDGEIIAGHGRVEAAKLLGRQTVPTLKLSHFDAAQRRAYVLADNKLALNSGWDRDVLAIELKALIDLDFEVNITGFSLAAAELVLDQAREPAADRKESRFDDIPPLLDTGTAVSMHGDIWVLGRHRLLCGDPRVGSCYQELLGPTRADLLFTELPCGLAIDRGGTSRGAFTASLSSTLPHAAAACRDGAVAFLATDRRHLQELLSLGAGMFSGLEDVCVWTTTTGETGSIYRSGHELVLVFRIGAAASPMRGSGRSRSNVWNHAAVNARHATRADASPPRRAIKPVALVADAIADAGKRGDVVLDPFAGCGTTLIAAETTGRSGRAVELDPAACDRIVRRFEQVTGEPARLDGTDRNFEMVAAERGMPDATREEV